MLGCGRRTNQVEPIARTKIVASEGNIEELALGARNANHEQKRSFENYLELFSSLVPLNRWDSDALNALVLKNEIFTSDKTHLNTVLRNQFRQIPRSMIDFIPVEKIKHLDDRDPLPIESPEKAFDFYAFAKEKREDFWIVSIFALKKLMEQKVYHQHPFIIATYSTSGESLDGFVWWTIVDDDIQVWEDVEVKGDTFMTGTKDDLSKEELDETFEKRVFTPLGTFKSVYSNYPDGYIRAKSYSNQ